mmetsp:Transcript_24692/g.36567  ORF Transcript_24692/g.36567 Transcript_24692/m.36567 type:complete len:88 (+) Transcript_24692:95-358(+)
MPSSEAARFASSERPWSVDGGSSNFDRLFMSLIDVCYCVLSSSGLFAKYSSEYGTPMVAALLSDSIAAAIRVEMDHCHHQHFDLTHS